MKNSIIAFMMTLTLCGAVQAQDYGHISTKSTQKDSDTAVYNLGGYNGWLQNSLGFYKDAYVTFNLESVASGVDGWNTDSLTFSMYNINQETKSSFGTVTAADNSGGTFETLFGAGDTVGFSISNGEKTVYNTPGIDGAKGTYVATLADDGAIYIGFFVNSYTKNDVSLADVVYSIRVSGTAPNGQPLPGVLATMLLGAGVFGARRRKRG